MRSVFLKSLVKKLLHRVGLVAVSVNHAGARYVNEDRKLTPFHVVLLRVFPNLNGLTFVQIGANDGERADPIREYIQQNGWRGLFIEPVPAFCAKLRENYGDRGRFEIVNAAVDLQSGERPLYSIREGLPGVPDWAGGLASFSQHRVEEAAKQLGLTSNELVTTRVKTITWDDVWPALQKRPCDILVTDTEGYDLVLLRAANLQAHRPRVIHFEHACVSRTEQLAFYDELFQLGYEITTHGGDTIAYQSHETQ